MSSFSAVQCVVCGSGGLEANDDVLECPVCNRCYPVLSGIPVPVPDVGIVPAAPFAPATARRLIEAFGLEPNPVTTLRLRQASRQSVRFGDPGLNAEGSHFLACARARGHAVAPSDPASPGALPGRELPRYRWLIDYIPRAMPPGRESMANVRFENVGRVLMPSAGFRRITLTCVWRDAGGGAVPTGDLRTPLPVDVAPGRQMTLPIRLRAPTEPGRYTITLTMVAEGLSWLNEDARTIGVQVRRRTAFRPSPKRAAIPAQTGAGGRDQANGRTLLATWLKRHAPVQPRILEIGGNALPAIEGIPGDLYNVDLDLLGLQVAAIVAGQRGNRVRALCADAHALPFDVDFFDAIVMVDTLHRFPDPAALLRRLRGHLRQGGFIAACCEPVGHIWPGSVQPYFLAELQRGANVQSFILPEYDQIFQNARLTPAEAAVENTSLTVRLVVPASKPIMSLVASEPAPGLFQA